MSYRERSTPSSISSLAEHLDLALATSEDLMRASTAKADFHIRLRLELAALTHVLQARQLAEDALGEVALQPRALSAFLLGTDALEAAGAQARPPVKPAENGLLIGGRILAADLRLLLASALAELGEYYSLDPYDERDEETGVTPSFADSEVALWAHGPGETQ